MSAPSSSKSLPPKRAYTAVKELELSLMVLRSWPPGPLLYDQGCFRGRLTLLTAWPSFHRTVEICLTSKNLNLIPDRQGFFSEVSQYEDVIVRSVCGLLLPIFLSKLGQVVTSYLRVQYMSLVEGPVRVERRQGGCSFP